MTDLSRLDDNSTGTLDDLAATYAQLDQARRRDLLEHALRLADQMREEQS
jgi:hypothetical protein